MQPQPQPPVRLSGFAADVFKVYNEKRCRAVVRAIMCSHNDAQHVEGFRLFLRFAELDCIASIRDFIELLLGELEVVNKRNRRDRVALSETSANRLVLFLEQMWRKIQRNVLAPYRENEWTRQVMQVMHKRRNLFDVLLTSIASRPFAAKKATVELVERIASIGPKHVNKPLRVETNLQFERAKLQVSDPRYVKFERTFRRRGIDAADKEYVWDTRQAFLSLLAGVHCDSPFLRFLSTDFITMEICKYMEDVPYNYIVAEHF